MKKRIVLVLIATLTAFIINGCRSTGVTNPEYYTQDICPNLLAICDTTVDYGYFYLVDKNTGVVYLCYNGGYKRAITVMLNTDGTPITAEQLGIKY